MNRGFMGPAYGLIAGRQAMAIHEIDMGRSGAGARGGSFRGGFQGGGFRGNIQPGPIDLASSARPKRRESLGAFEGITIDASIPDLCALLKKALAANARSASEAGEWKDFWDATERLRPSEQSAAQWRANLLNQMSTQCPDDVARMKAMPGTRGIREGCVKVTVLKNPKQVISTVIEPYQTKGWDIVRVPVGKMEEVSPSFGRVALYQPVEIWACPPGQEIPKKTSLSAREAAELGHSISDALVPIQAGKPGAAECIQGSHVDVAVVNRLLMDLEAKAAANESVDVTQDQLDAVKKVIDCASKAGATVTPPPETAAAAMPGAATGFPWLPVAAAGGAGVLALFVL